MFLNIMVLIPAILVLIGLRVLRPNALVWALAWFGTFWVILNFGFKVPIPQSVVHLYLGIVLLSLAAYVSSSRERWAGFYGPIERLATDPGRRMLLALVIVLIPAGSAFAVYRSMAVPIQAPLFGRTVHPAPPDTINVHGNDLDLITGDNPIRALKGHDDEAWNAHMDNGRRVYYENCFYCHGDYMGGDGMYSYALNPIPSNFTDQGVLPMLQESFIFWRISKGGPGLPEEGGPWDTAMPAWETFLDEEELWDVTSYLYEFTNWEPRKQEVHH